MKRVKVGDLIEIPSPAPGSASLAYARVVFIHRAYVHLVEVYKVLSKVPLAAIKLTNAKRLLPPIFVALMAPLRNGTWRIVGNIPVEGFTFPLFRFHGKVDATLDEDGWMIWDGEERKRVGFLSEEQRELELERVMGYGNFENRIFTALEPGYVPITSETTPSPPSKGGWQGPGKAGEEALIVEIPLETGTAASAEALRSAMDLDDLLRQHVEGQGVGIYDGNEVGMGFCRHYLYGPNAGRIFEKIAPILEQAGLLSSARITREPTG